MNKNTSSSERLKRASERGPKDDKEMKAERRINISLRSETQSNGLKCNQNEVNVTHWCRRRCHHHHCRQRRSQKINQSLTFRAEKKTETTMSDKNHFNKIILLVFRRVFLIVIYTRLPPISHSISLPFASSTIHIHSLSTLVLLIYSAITFCAPFERCEHFFAYEFVYSLWTFIHHFAYTHVRQ